MFHLLKILASSHRNAAREGFHILRHKPLSHIMTMFVLSLALTLPMLLFIFMSNVTELSQDWQKGEHITLYLKSSVTKEETKALIKTLASDKTIAASKFISPEQGMQELMQEEGIQDFMQYLPENPLPAVIEISPAATVDTPEKMTTLYKTFQKMPEVEDIKLDLDWVKRLHALFAFAGKLGMAGIILLCLAVIVIIGNALRLSIHSRSKQIEVLKMIGATDAFIIRPFLYQGLSYGLIAAALASLWVTLFVYSLKPTLYALVDVYKMNYSIRGMSLSKILMLFVFAGILSWLSAHISVRRQLAFIEPHPDL